MDNVGFSRLNNEKLLACVKKCYGFEEDMQMKLMKYSENLTYKLFSEGTGEKYVLRVFRPGYHKEEEMIGELTWIHKLSLDTDIKTADVILGLNGNFVQTADGFYIAVFEFIEGHEITEIAADKLYFYMEKIGEIAAKLHKHVTNWKESGDLIRFSWDLKDIIGRDGRWGHYSNMKSLPPSDISCYDDASRIIRYRLEKFGRTRDRYGLFHSDLNIHNILINDDDEIYILDFDDCGYGWFLYDIATAVMEYFDEELDCVLSAILKGYEKVRKLSEEEKEEIPTFIIARKILRIGWIASHSDNDTVKAISPSYFEKTALLAKEYCTANMEILNKLK